VTDGAGDHAVDLAYSHPLDDAFECNAAARLTSGGTGMNESAILGEDEEFKPFGMLLVHFLKF